MRTALHLTLILLVLDAHNVEPTAAQVAEPVLRVYGLVDRPFNITYSEFLRLPLVSVEASCICVGSGPENPGVNSFVVYTYDWTGVRLSHLLELAGVKDGAVDVVFRDNTQYRQVWKTVFCGSDEGVTGGLGPAAAWSI